MYVPVLGNPPAGLADLRIESAIRTFCGFEDCGFSNKSQKLDADLRIESSIRIFCGLADCGFPNAGMYMYMYTIYMLVFLIKLKLKKNVFK